MTLRNLIKEKEEEINPRKKLIQSVGEGLIKKGYQIGKIRYGSVPNNKCYSSFDIKHHDLDHIAIYPGNAPKYEFSDLGSKLEKIFLNTRPRLANLIFEPLQHHSITNSASETNWILYMGISQARGFCDELYQDIVSIGNQHGASIEAYIDSYVI